MDNLPDVQNFKPDIELSLNQVGIENVELLFKLESINKEIYDCFANVSMYVSLEKNKKGVSMSRFIEVIKEFTKKPLKHDNINKFLYNLCDKLESNYSVAKFVFKLPVEKQSIVSNKKFVHMYDCWFEGTLNIETKEFNFFEGCKIQYASYCPCSALLSDALQINHGKKGFPHAQRSFVYVDVLVKENETLWLEELIQLVESSIKTLPYEIIKRPDEQKIAEIAAENPIFVEDAARLITKSLSNENRIEKFYIKCIHEESIHKHDAVCIHYE